MARSTDLTKGNITRGLWGFALPLMLGNVLQQLYNLVDTWVVGRYVGDNALAAVVIYAYDISYISNYRLVSWQQFICVYGIWQKRC